MGKNLIFTADNLTAGWPQTKDFSEALTGQQVRNWAGSGKAYLLTGGLVPAEEAERLERWFVLIYDEAHGRVRAGDCLPIAYTQGRRLGPEEELWPAPLLRLVLHRESPATPEQEHLSLRRVEQLIEDGAITSGVKVGRVWHAPLASVLAYQQQVGLVWGGPPLSGCGLGDGLQQVHRLPQVGIGHGQVDSRGLQ